MNRNSERASCFCSQHPQHIMTTASDSVQFISNSKHNCLVCRWYACCTCDTRCILTDKSRSREETFVVSSNVYHLNLCDFSRICSDASNFLLFFILTLMKARMSVLYTLHLYGKYIKIATKLSFFYMVIPVQTQCVREPTSEGFLHRSSLWHTCMQHTHTPSL